MSDPIQVDAGPGKEQVTAAVRQVLLAVIPLATAAGMTQTAGALNTLLAMSGAIATVLVFVWGQLHTRKAAKTLAVVAASAPDDVAVVKGATPPVPQP